MVFVRDVLQDIRSAPSIVDALRITDRLGSMAGAAGARAVGVCAAAIDDPSALPSFPISGFTYGSATRRSLQLG